MSERECPKCESRNVTSGAIVLACLDCGWTKMGETPCDKCGKPSIGCHSIGLRSVSHYCREHQPNAQQRQDAIVEFFNRRGRIAT